MNIFTREMKANTKALILWCIGMIAMIGGGMSKYSGLTASDGSINDMLELLPQSLINIYGISGFDLSTAIGFYGFLFLYLLLIATIHATMLGAGIIAKEERDKTTEFLFVKPISRAKVITSKLLAAVMNILILNLVTGLASYWIVNYFDQAESIAWKIFLLMAGLFAMQLLFLVIGAFVAALSSKPKGAASVAAGLLLVMFMLAMFSNATDKLANLKYVTPFKYYEAKAVISGEGFELIFIVLTVIIIVFSLVGTYTFYNRKDLSV